MTLRPSISLRAAFIVTVAVGAASAATGCEDGVITNPPPANSCPETMPGHGEGCDVIGLSCGFGVDDCGFELNAECSDTGWQVNGGGSCNPPPPECPETRPELGEECEAQPNTWGVYPDWCSFPEATPCGELDIILGCEALDDGQTYVWTVREEPACEVAEPWECFGYGSAPSCNADPGCNWLIPGCADETQMTAPTGCFPVDDCLQTGCGEWGSCETVVHDPCGGGSPDQPTCGACGAELNVCLPQDTTGP